MNKEPSDDSQRPHKNKNPEKVVFHTKALQKYVDTLQVKTSLGIYVILLYG
jgi:hypothetical protein